MGRLSSLKYSITGNDFIFNGCFFADDVLPYSTIVTGLETIINMANVYVGNHTIRFNASNQAIRLNPANRGIWF